jgi:hypothetical protein
MKKDEMYTSEFSIYKINSLTVDIWYQGVFTAKYICSKCNQSLLNHIQSISPDSKLSVSGWVKK